MPKRTLLFITIAAMLMTLSCKKKSATIIKVNVTSSGEAAGGVNVKLLSDDHRTSFNYVASGTSDSAGVINFTVTPSKVYYLYVSGSYLLSNANTTFIINGEFTSQQQIDDSPVQSPPAQVGDDIEMDINGDGAINASDKVIKITAPSMGNTSTADLAVNAKN